jgi:hypothetical protein
VSFGASWGAHLDRQWDAEAADKDGPRNQCQRNNDGQDDAYRPEAELGQPGFLSLSMMIRDLEIGKRRLRLK